MRATPTSLPGIVFDEKRKVSPSRRSSPMYDPCASCARGGPPLALAAGGEHQQVPARHRVDVEHVERLGEAVEHLGGVRGLQHGVHRPPEHDDRPPGGAAGLGERLQPRDVRGEGGGDDQPLGLLHQPPDRLDQHRLGAAGVGVEDVGRVAGQHLHALVAEPAQHARVERLADQRRRVGLEVGRVEDPSRRACR